MSAREVLKAFVDTCGNGRKASKKLGIPYPTLASILNGNRGVGKSIAERLEAGSKGKLKASKMIWIEPTRGPSVGRTQS